MKLLEGAAVLVHEESGALRGFGSADRQAGRRTPRSSRSPDDAGLGVGTSSVSVTSARDEWLLIDRV
jgi:hypothetical protein